MHRPAYQQSVLGGRVYPLAIRARPGRATTTCRKAVHRLSSPAWVLPGTGLLRCGRAGPFLQFAPFALFAPMPSAAMPPLAEPVAAPPDHWPLAAVLVVDDESLTMKQVEAGALAARVGKLASGDEIGALAGHLDHLLDTLAAQTSALRCWNAELDAKVAERTQALEARSAELETAQAQLLRTGKLAAVGQLTASIAHEVNNPIAVIQGNLDLVRELLPAAAGRDEPADGNRGAGRCRRAGRHDGEIDRGAAGHQVHVPPPEVRNGCACGQPDRRGG